MDKEAGTTPSETNLHGPGGILSKPGQGGKKKKKKMDKPQTEQKDQNDIVFKEFNSEFVTTKEGDRYRFVLITGSAFEDRDGEIIAEKAFERDCDEMEATGNYGELLWWHCDGTQHATDKEARPYLPLGQVDTSLVYEKLNIESGFYYDNQVAESLQEKAADFGASKSFFYKEDEPVDGVYSFIRTKERSLLPRQKESNLLTRLFGHKEKEMADNKERIAALRRVLGDEKTEQVLTAGKDMSKKAEEFLASKEQKEEPVTEEKETDTNPILLAIKESNDKLALQIKEQGEAAQKEFTAFKDSQTKELDGVKANVAQLQGTVASLMGFQPKGFKASEKGAAPELTEEQKNQTKEIEKAHSGAPASVIDWVLNGNTPFPAA